MVPIASFRREALPEGRSWLTDLGVIEVRAGFHVPGSVQAGFASGIPPPSATVSSALQRVHGKIRGPARHGQAGGNRAKTGLSSFATSTRILTLFNNYII
jgi:hypothetical protein